MAEGSGQSEGTQKEGNPKIERSMNLKCWIKWREHTRAPFCLEKIKHWRKHTNLGPEWQYSREGVWLPHDRPGFAHQQLIKSSECTQSDSWMQTKRNPWVPSVMTSPGTPSKTPKLRTLRLWEANKENNIWDALKVTSLVFRVCVCVFV